ncbi:MAG: hypothetical protein FWC10_06710 [Lentimicrobiaceae bacterium]|nr:hypothetical protein [Lentimicrobiaceae bacterium]MCL2246786.1 hypothetical protein [Lentimicrobiaceae bacterium]
MQTIKVQNRQTIWDIAIQYCGDREAAFQIAEINDISLTEDLPAGLSLSVPEPINARVVNHYFVNNIVPATAVETTAISTGNNIITNDGEYIMVTNNNNDIQIVTNN